MEQKSMTALISAFSRAYHTKNNKVKIFDDNIAGLLFTKEEYAQISKNMSDGIAFFNPEFIGNDKEALRWIVDNQLSPLPLGRAAFAEKSLETATAIGAKQYLIMGAGYDTFAYRQPDWAKSLQIFEIDRLVSVKDKKRRLENMNIAVSENVHYISADFNKKKWYEKLTQSTAFNSNKISFVSILGVTFYISKQIFEELLCALNDILPAGSSVIFDYPDQNSYTDKAGQRAKKQAMLANAAKEKMLSSYSYLEIEKLLSRCGFLIYEHLTPSEMTEQYFKNYNLANPANTITAFDNVNYCLAVKK